MPPNPHPPPHPLQGSPEAGIDGGGLLKEFLDTLVKEAFSPARGLFVETPAHALYPNPFSRALVAATGTAGPAVLAAGAAPGAAPSAAAAAPAPPPAAPGLWNAWGLLDSAAPAAPPPRQRTPWDVAAEAAAGGGGDGGDEDGDEDMGSEGELPLNPDEAWIAAAMREDERAARAAEARRRARAARIVVPDRSRDHLAHYAFLGRLLAKALYEGILVAPRFAPFVLRRLLGRANAAADLPSLDPQLARGLQAVTDSAAAVRRARAAAAAAVLAAGGDAAAAAVAAARVPDDVEAMGLTFSVTDRDDAPWRQQGAAAASAPAAPSGPPPSEVTTPLLPGGDALPVTCDTAERYVALFAHHRLTGSIAAQVSAFVSGFRAAIPLQWVAMFSPSELALLLGGREDLDVAAVVADMRRHCHLSGYADGHPTVEMFWRVLGAFDPSDLARFLAFVTSVPRPPLLGFASLQPRLGIALLASHGQEGAAGRLPVAATCMNLIKIPEYPSEAVLREKLLLAIRDSGGFLLT